MKIEQLINDAWETVVDNATPAEVDAFQKNAEQHGLTIRVTNPEVEAAPAPESDDPAADLTAYMADVHPEPFAKAASDAAPMAYDAAISDALAAGKSALDIGRDVAIQNLARAAGLSPEVRTITRRAQHAKRALDAPEQPGPAAVESPMQEEPTTPPTPALPAPETDANLPPLVGPLSLNDVIYASDGSQHYITALRKNKGGKTACKLNVPATSADYRRTPPDHGEAPICRPCMVAKAQVDLGTTPEPPTPPAAEDADDKPAAKGKGKGKGKAKVTEAATMAEALQPTDEPKAPKQPKVELIATKDARYPHVAAVFAFNFAPAPLLNVFTHAALGLATTVCGRTPDLSQRRKWRYLTGEYPITCDACRRALGLEGVRKDWGGFPKPLRAALNKAWTASNEDGDPPTILLSGAAQKAAVAKFRAARKAERAAAKATTETPAA